MINIFIIDDHPLVAGGIAMMLKDLDNVTICGTAGSGAEAMGILENCQPEIILLDINLPDMDGLVLCEKIRAKNKVSKIIGLTSTSDALIVIQLLQKGANGYLLKNMERSEFLEAIDRVMKGKIFVSRSANDHILEQYTSVSSALSDIPAVTRREKEILTLLDDGLTGPQIAEKLCISHYTVETHRKNLLQKFNVSTTQALLKKVQKFKLLG